MATTVTTPTPAPQFWSPSVWSSIQSQVVATAGAVRVSQNVFPGPPTPLTGVTSVPAPHFDFNKMTLTEGITKPYVELAVEFSLTYGQVQSELTATAATMLSKFAARDLALAEDAIILQGRKGAKALPPTARIESGGESLKDGIMGLILPGNEVIVNAPGPEPTNSGGEIWAAIQDAISRLTANTQSVPWALIADTVAFGAISGSVLNGNPLCNILAPGVMICGTPAMPKYTGLFIALGGDPTTIYVDTDATMEPTNRGDSGLYRFRVFERVQVVALDPRAFVKLDFSYLAKSTKPPTGPARRVPPRRVAGTARPAARKSTGPTPTSTP